MHLNLRQSVIHMWVLVAEITKEIILGLYILHSYDAFVDGWSDMLKLGQEIFLLWSHRAQQRSSHLVMDSLHVIPSKCERILAAQLETPFSIKKMWS